MSGDWWVEVCDSCIRACCWHGDILCRNAERADIVLRKASELRAIGREHDFHYSRERIRDVTGIMPDLLDEAAQ